MDPTYTNVTYSEVLDETVFFETLDEITRVDLENTLNLFGPVTSITKRNAYRVDYGSPEIAERSEKLLRRLCLTKKPTESISIHHVLYQPPHVRIPNTLIIIFQEPIRLHKVIDYLEKLAKIVTFNLLPNNEEFPKGVVYSFSFENNSKTLHVLNTLKPGSLTPSLETLPSVESEPEASIVKSDKPDVSVVEKPETNTIDQKQNSLSQSSSFDKTLCFIQVKKLDRVLKITGTTRLGIDMKLLFSFFNNFGKNKIKFEHLEPFYYRLQVTYDQSMNASRANSDIKKMLPTSTPECNDAPTLSDSNAEIKFDNVLRDKKQLDIMIFSKNFDVNLLKNFIDAHGENELFLTKKGYQHVLYKVIFANIEDASSCKGAIYRLITTNTLLTKENLKTVALTNYQSKNKRIDSSKTYNETRTRLSLLKPNEMTREYFEDMVTSIGPVDIITYRNDSLPDVTQCFVTYCHEETCGIGFQLFQKFRPRKVALLDFQKETVDCPKCSNPIFKISKSKHLKYCRNN